MGLECECQRNELGQCEIPLVKDLVVNSIQFISLRSLCLCTRCSIFLEWSSHGVVLILFMSQHHEIIPISLAHTPPHSHLCLRKVLAVLNISSLQLSSHSLKLFTRLPPLF